VKEGDPDQFSVDVRKWVEKAKTNADLAFQATAELALGYIKNKTPVDTGFLRSSWTIVKGDSASPIAGGGEAGALEVIASLKMGDKIGLVNPAPYAMRINFGFQGEDKLGRHYHQQGRHMVEQTMAAMPTLAEQAVRWINGGGTPFNIQGAG
jgi:hypothetical protein